MIISFAWTTEALLSGNKIVTRRFWNSKYAQRFKKGDIVKAYSKLPHYGGEHIANIRIIETPYRQPLNQMTDEDEAKEGGLWGSAKEFGKMMREKALTLSKEALLEAKGKYDLSPFVVEFEIVEAINLEEAK